MHIKLSWPLHLLLHPLQAQDVRLLGFALDGRGASRVEGVLKKAEELVQDFRAKRKKAEQSNLVAGPAFEAQAAQPAALSHPQPMPEALPVAQQNAALAAVMESQQQAAVEPPPPPAEPELPTAQTLPAKRQLCGADRPGMAPKRQCTSVGRHQDREYSAQEQAQLARLQAECAAVQSGLEGDATLAVESSVDDPDTGGIAFVAVVKPRCDGDPPPSWSVLELRVPEDYPAAPPVPCYAPSGATGSAVVASCARAAFYLACCELEAQPPATLAQLAPAWVRAVRKAATTCAV